MIQDPSKDLTLIVYNTPKPPRYFKINKALVKTFLIAIPLLIISSITISFLYSLFLKNKMNQIKSKQPEVITQLQAEKAAVASQVAQLQTTNEELTQKISLGSSTESASELAMFSTPAGMKDRRSEKLAKIGDIKVKTQGNKISVNFDLNNNGPKNTKLSGYISIVQFQSNMIQFYPSYDLSQKDLLMNFSKGESFQASRFRPVRAEFAKASKASAKYKIYIFSRTGDLLFYRQTGPFNIE